MDAPPDLLIIRDVRALDPSGNLDVQGDVVLERGRITRVGRDAARNLAGAEKARVIDGRGKLLLPAFVDLHAHLREPGQDTKRTSAAASRPRLRWVCACVRDAQHQTGERQPARSQN